MHRRCVLSPVVPDDISRPASGPVLPAAGSAAAGASDQAVTAAVVARLRASGCVFAEDEAALLMSDSPTATELWAMVDQRVGGAPLEHVLGWAEFCGHRYAVEPGVFVPRRRTEFLAEQAIRLCRPGAVLVDLCCGTGAIGAAVAAAVGDCEVHAADIDPAAVRCAERNLSVVGGAVYCGDLYLALPADLRGRIDVLLVNAPYVPTGEIRLMPTEAREYEARVALDGGPDGLDIQRRVIADAPQWLSRRGTVLIETSERQAPSTVAAFADSGLSPQVLRSPDLDATVVTGTMPPSGRDR